MNINDSGMISRAGPVASYAGIVAAVAGSSRSDG